MCSLARKNARLLDAAPNEKAAFKGHRIGDTELETQNGGAQKGGEDLLVIKGVVYAPLGAGHTKVIMRAMMPGL